MSTGRRSRQVVDPGEGHRRLLLHHLPKGSCPTHSLVRFISFSKMLPKRYHQFSFSISIFSYISLAIFMSNNDQTKRWVRKASTMSWSPPPSPSPPPPPSPPLSPPGWSGGLPLTTWPRALRPPGSWSLPPPSGFYIIVILIKILSSVPPRSPFANLLISPWLVLGVVVMLMKRVGTLSAPAASFSSTLIMLWPDDEERVL